MITPVTDEDVAAAHNAVYARPDEFNDVPVMPITDDHWGEEWKAGLRRALERDRQRVALRQVELSNLEVALLQLPDAND